MESVNIPELVQRLGSDEDAVRKMAVFKLQSNIGDPSFAEGFIIEGGLTKLKFLALHASGNTLAYSLTSFSRLLEVDKGWECVDSDIIERVVELVVSHPLVNILRGAMSILVSIVSQPQSTRPNQPGMFGYRALQPAIAVYPQFLEMLVSRLSSADHALCANALQLINCLMRDSIANDGDDEWPKFIKRLQDLGVIKSAYVLMQGSALQDLAQPLLEFQSLTKLLLRRWRDVQIDLDKTDHRRALKGLHLASNPTKQSEPEPLEAGGDAAGPKARKHNPEKWRRLGFQTEFPQNEFQQVGFLGMMDLTDFVRKDEDGFQKILLEQSALPAEKRCPIARASLEVTLILYDHFEVEKWDMEDSKAFIVLESRTHFDKIFKPLLLQWSRVHTASLQAFLRLWKVTGAEHEDFDKIAELVRILVESVVGSAARTKDVQDVEAELAEFEYQRLRELQMELVELAYEETWGRHLKQVRDELHQEALQFMKEQRIRCLLQGMWFPNGPEDTHQGERKNAFNSYRFVRLSHNRRDLHYADFDKRGSYEPSLEDLQEKIDLSIVSSVVSNISASSESTKSTASTIKDTPRKNSNTKITIHGYLPATSDSNLSGKSSSVPEESVLLTLYPQTHSLASEWLDGLLMLLNQQPITAETTKLMNLITDYGLKIRLLNVRFDGDALNAEPPEMPSREGLDEDYYYDVFGG